MRNTLHIVSKSRSSISQFIHDYPGINESSLLPAGENDVYENAKEVMARISGHRQEIE